MSITKEQLEKQWEIQHGFLTVRELLFDIREGLDDYGHEETVAEVKKIEESVVKLEEQVRKDFAE